jgi:hypothetical protein
MYILKGWIMFNKQKGALNKYSFSCLFFISSMSLSYTVMAQQAMSDQGSMGNMVMPQDSTSSSMTTQNPSPSASSNNGGMDESIGMPDMPYEPVITAHIGHAIPGSWSKTCKQTQLEIFVDPNTYEVKNMLHTFCRMANVVNGVYYYNPNPTYYHNMWDLNELSKSCHGLFKKGLYNDNGTLKCVSPN